MSPHRARHAASLALAAALLSACGSDGDAATSGALSGPEEAGGSETVVVTMERSRFEPRTVTVAAGTEVTFRNLDAAAHTVTSAAGAAVAFDSGQLAEGEQLVVRFDEAGSHEYLCEIHPTMRGTVVVE